MKGRARYTRLLYVGFPYEREFLIDKLLVRIHFIIAMLRWTGLAPWEFECSFPGSLASTFLGFCMTGTAASLRCYRANMAHARQSAIERTWNIRDSQLSSEYGTCKTFYRANMAHTRNSIERTWHMQDSQLSREHGTHKTVSYRANMAHTRQSIERTRHKQESHRANMARTRQSRPDLGLGCQAKVFNIFAVAPYLLGSGGGVVDEPLLGFETPLSHIMY